MLRNKSGTCTSQQLKNPTSQDMKNRRKFLPPPVFHILFFVFRSLKTHFAAFSPEVRAKHSLTLVQYVQALMQATYSLTPASAHAREIYPSATSVSAQSTAPPAAPRRVLWESPTNL